MCAHGVERTEDSLVDVVLDGEAGGLIPSGVDLQGKLVHVIGIACDDSDTVA